MSTETYPFYDPEHDLIVIEDTEDTGEWMLTMLCLSMELNSANESLRRLIVEQSKECKLSGVDEEMC